MFKPYSAAKDHLIHQREWVSLAIFFSLLGALILIAYLNQQKIDEEVASKLLIEEENRR